jgi:hypothetical protein
LKVLQILEFHIVLLAAIDKFWVSKGKIRYIDKNNGGNHNKGIAGYLGKVTGLSNKNTEISTETIKITGSVELPS